MSTTQPVVDGSGGPSVRQECWREGCRRSVVFCQNFFCIGVSPSRLVTRKGWIIPGRGRTDRHTDTQRLAGTPSSLSPSPSSSLFLSPCLCLPLESEKSLPPGFLAYSLPGCELVTLPPIQAWPFSLRLRTHLTIVPVSLGFCGLQIVPLKASL